MSTLSPSEVLKYGWRVDRFIDKYKKGEPFELVSGQDVRLAFDDGIYETLLRKRNYEYQKLVFVDAKIKTKKYKFSSFKKTVEFGGKPEGKGAGVDIEMREINAINEQFNKIRSTTGQTSIPVKVKNQTIYAYQCVKTPGVPKSDFSVLDEKGNEVLWISHKEGSAPRDFQQWGGMTEAGIQDHPEVQVFIQQVKDKFPNGIPNATTVAKMIKDNKLKNYAVYGVDYKLGSTVYGRQNVSIVLQGPVKLQKYGNVWKFTANHAHDNGEDINAGFEPVLMAMYKGDRSNFGVKGARFAIQPKMSRKVTEWLD